ncbi:MAG: GAF domain-containing protein [Candidatus Marinimicrobia bacterium]|nr:GAF domain-containing protein [Candidatus Neomarinimicrobiota bacterium]
MMQLYEPHFFRAFVKVSKAISSTLDLQEVLDLIVKNAIDALKLKAGAISLWNKQENRLEMITHLNLSQDFLNKGPVYADKSMPRALTSREPVIIPNIEYDDQLQYPEACRKEGIKALLSIPIIFKDDVIGVLRLYDSKVRAFTEEEIEFMTALAEQGGVTINNALFMDQLKKDHQREMDDLWNWFSDMTNLPGY